MFFEILNLKLVKSLYLDYLWSDIGFQSPSPEISFFNSFKDPLPSLGKKFSDTLKLHENCLSKIFHN